MLGRYSGPFERPGYFGYFWNSGRLKSGPEMTSFLEPPHPRPQMLACAFVVSSNPQTPGRMTLLFLFYRRGELDTKMLNNCPQVSPVPRDPVTPSPRPLILLSMILTIFPPRHHLIVSPKPLRSVLSLPSVLPNIDRGESGHI